MRQTWHATDPLTWFIGDSVLTRYSETHMVRILPNVPEPGVHRYRVTLFFRSGRKELAEEFRETLIEALKLGEEWVPWSKST